MKKKSLLVGFTIIEILMVIALMGTLAAIVVTIINPVGQFERARDATRKSDLAQIQKALEQYYNDNNSYPVSSGGPNYYILDSSHSWGSPWSPYMDLIPKDPNSTQRYVYTSTGQSYKLYAHLERGGQDPQACNVGGTDCTGVPVANACNNGGSPLACNFGVSSPNVSP